MKHLLFISFAISKKGLYFDTTRNHFLSSVCESRIKKYQNVSGAYRNVSNTRILALIFQFYVASQNHFLQKSFQIVGKYSRQCLNHPTTNRVKGLDQAGCDVFPSFF